MQPNGRPHYIEDELAVRLPRHDILSTGVTNEMLKFYGSIATDWKKDVDKHAAEINQRVDKMRFVNQLISDLNTLINDKDEINLGLRPDLLHKMKQAKELGVSIGNPSQLTYNAAERTRLIESMHMSADGWDKENKSQSQKMDIVVKQLDRLMMMMKNIDDQEKSAKKKIIDGIAR